MENLKLNTKNITPTLTIINYKKNSNSFATGNMKWTFLQTATVASFYNRVKVGQKYRALTRDGHGPVFGDAKVGLYRIRMAIPSTHSMSWKLHVSKHMTIGQLLLPQDYF